MEKPNVSPIPSGNGCDHIFIFIEFFKEKIPTIEPNLYRYEKTYMFFCSKCLEERKVVKCEVSFSKPNWY